VQGFDKSLQGEGSNYFLFKKYRAESGNFLTIGRTHFPILTAGLLPYVIQQESRGL
jgi:hypothetical protein